MSIAAPLSTHTERYTTRGGILVHRQAERVALEGAIEPLIDALDAHRGVLLASTYDYPGRYTRWDLGFLDPPLEIVCQGRNFRFTALNERGMVLLPALSRAASAVPGVELAVEADRRTSGTIATPERRFAEEERSKQPSIFSVLRAIIDLFSSENDAHLGLYGAFGYDLALQFEPRRLRLQRPPDQRDLVLYLPDELLVVDHRREAAVRYSYDFEVDGQVAADRPGGGETRPYGGPGPVERDCDHEPGEFAATVRLAHEAFRQGDLFEVVPGQIFFEPCITPPSTVFRRLRRRNPSPYGFFINLGEGEYLVGASPEMYVRVDGPRVETCPISGTIARGLDPIEDAAQIQALLNSGKDEAELTMCTDVDRNDKSRICVPGSVRVIGRRQIELYSRLIHTVDHVEGMLRPGFDALDAFLTHTWAVTVTGAPKAAAMQFLEEVEKSPRAWYGGAIGRLSFDGAMNTGLTLRTIRIRGGVAEVRAGATLLHDSDPDEEERETRLKASALLDAIRRDDASICSPPRHHFSGSGKRILLVDHRDSFVHTLANYLRQTGAEVITLRSGFEAEEIDRLAPDLIVLSPGPGRPADFDIAGTIAAALAHRLPVFGVCLGLQGLIEYCGGVLDVLPIPCHGRSSCIKVRGGRLFAGLPEEFEVGRYHSLHADRAAFPRELQVTAETADGTIMAVEHQHLPLAAVQFHPESILTRPGDLGLQLVDNAVAMLVEETALRHY